MLAVRPATGLTLVPHADPLLTIGRVDRTDDGFTCLVNRDATPQRAGKLLPACWDAEGSRTIVPLALRVGKLLASGKGRSKRPLAECPIAARTFKPYLAARA